MSNHTEANLNFIYTFKNTEATDALRDYAEEKLHNSLKKFVHQDVDVNLVFDVEKHRQIAEISFNCFGTNFTCKEESENMYKSIDALVETISKRLRRHKTKVTDHHHA